MVRTSIVLGVLWLLAGCANGSGATAGASDPSSASGGTPDSLFPQSIEDSPDAAGGAGAAGGAFVRRAFDPGAGAVVKASCAPGKLRLTLDGVLFDFDHDTLKRGADDVLSQIKKATFDAYPTAHVTVEGHTDNVGTDAHNDDLSARRAKTVSSWFEAHGVDARRLASRGFGKRWPRWPNDTEANRAKNRRVELVVLDTTAANACNAPGDHAPPALGDAPKGIVVAGNGSSSGGPAGPGTHRSLGQLSANPIPPEAFSYLWGDRADVRSHTCFTTDPAWARPGPIPLGYPKGDPLGYNDGKVVDHCPTEGLVATCDQRSYVPAIYSYYREVSQAVLELAEHNCAAGKWTRLVPPDPIPKIQPDTGTYAAVCNTPQIARCIEARADATDANAILMVKGCAALEAQPRGPGKPPAPPQPPRCATLGATGRCEYKGYITYYYDPHTSGFRYLCSGPGMVWSAP